MNHRQVRPAALTAMALQQSLPGGFEVDAVAREAGGALLESLELFDIYADQKKNLLALKAKYGAIVSVEQLVQGA